MYAMTEITIGELPTLSEKSCWISISDTAEKKYEKCTFSLGMMWQYYRAWILLSFFLLCILGFVLMVLFSTQYTPAPCLKYTGQTLASTVSTTCLQYMWDQNCASKQPYTFPSEYAGWWNQSPQGTTMVSCRGGKSGTQCGVGSLENIALYMQFCNIMYNQ